MINKEIWQRWKEENPEWLQKRNRRLSKKMKRIYDEGKSKLPSRKGMEPWNKGLTKLTDIRIAKTVENRKGWHHSEKSKQKMKEVHKKQWKESEKIGKSYEELYGIEKAKSMIEKITGDKNPAKKPEVREKIGELKKGNQNFKGKHHSQKTKEKMSEARGKYYKIHPEMREKRGIQLNTDIVIKKRLLIALKKPNNAELKLNGILQNNFPSEWKYVGNGEFILGGKCPDFLNCNGKKQVIELFGNWFHSKEFAEHFKRQYESPEQRIEHYKKYGFDCLVIWESELKESDKIIERIRGFTNGR